MKDSQNPSTQSRRKFLRSSSLAGLTIITFPNAVRGTEKNSKVRMGLIGSGGRATAAIGKNSETVGPLMNEHIVAIAEPEPDGRGGPGIRKVKEAQPGVNVYTDYRELFDKHDDLDGVWIGCPDHTHFPAAIRALENGSAVYCEKPLTWSIGEAAALRAKAAEAGVATQMGNQGHSSDSIRGIVENLQTGALGSVGKVVSHMGKSWGATSMPPKGEKPAGLDWDAWLGPAEDIGYHEDLHPFTWRKYGPFGTGTLGDMACHTIDGAVWGLRLNEADTFEVEAETGGPQNGGHALDAIVRWDFPARGDMPAVSLWWYQGELTPERPEGVGEDKYSTLYYGDKGLMSSGSHCQGVKLYGDGMVQAPETIARVSNHADDWICAIKDPSGPAPSSHFGYSGVLTEIVLAGVVALAEGEKLTFDLKQSRFVNNDNANTHLWRKPRQGWEFGYPS